MYSVYEPVAAACSCKDCSYQREGDGRRANAGCGAWCRASRSGAIFKWQNVVEEFASVDDDVSEHAPPRADAAARRTLAVTLCAPQSRFHHSRLCSIDAAALASTFPAHLQSSVGRPPPATPPLRCSQLLQLKACRPDKNSVQGALALHAVFKLKVSMHARPAPRLFAAPGHMNHPIAAILATTCSDDVAALRFAAAAAAAQRIASAYPTRLRPRTPLPHGPGAAAAVRGG